MKNLKRQARHQSFVSTSNTCPAGIQVGKTKSHVGVANCLDFLVTNFYRPIDVADLVIVSGLSRRGFFKAFQKHTGLRPGQALRQLRIEHAKRLLVESDASLEDIATQCGYRSANSFWVAFRDVTGVAPKKFQRQAWLRTYLRLRSQKGLADPRPVPVTDPMILAGLDERAGRVVGALRSGERATSVVEERSR